MRPLFFHFSTCVFLSLMRTGPPVAFQQVCCRPEEQLPQTLARSYGTLFYFRQTTRKPHRFCLTSPAVNSHQHFNKQDLCKAEPTQTPRLRTRRANSGNWLTMSFDTELHKRSYQKINSDGNGIRFSICYNLSEKKKPFAASLPHIP